MRTITIPTHHCLFSHKNSNSIDSIVTNIYALKQTIKYREQYHRGKKIILIKDDTIASKELANNIIPPHSAVICREDCGKLYGLKLIAKNIEDNINNRTTFAAIKLNKQEMVI